MALYFEQQGSGDPVVLVHGLFGSSTNLRGIARKLSRGFHVISVDLPNHGRTPHTSTMTYRDMSSALHDVLQSADFAAANWVGHSMGGKAVMDLSLTHPGSVERQVIIDIAPVRYTHGHDSLIDAMAALNLSELNSRADSDRALSAAIPDAATRLFLLQNLVLNAGTFSWRLNLPVLREYHDHIMGFPEHGDATFTGPTLILSGANSDYVSADTHDDILRYFPQASFQTVPGAGHWVHADQPQAVSDTIAGFLRTST